MSGHIPTSDNLWPLLNAGCDGSLTEPQVQELEGLLGSDPALRKLFIHHVQLRTDIQILCRADKACDDGLARIQAALSQASPPASPVIGFLPSILHGAAGNFSSGWPLAYLIATAILVTGLTIMRLRACVAAGADCPISPLSFRERGRG